MHQLILLATNHPMFWAHYVPTCSTLTKAKCNHSPCPPLATLVTPTSLFLQATGWPLYTWPHSRGLCPSQMGSAPQLSAPTIWGCVNYWTPELLNSWTLEVVVSWSDGLLNSNRCRPLRKKDPRKMLPAATKPKLSSCQRPWGMNPSHSGARGPPLSSINEVGASLGWRSPPFETTPLPRSRGFLLPPKSPMPNPWTTAWVTHSNVLRTNPVEAKSKSGSWCKVL